MKLLGELIVGIIRSTELYTQQEIEVIVEDFDIFEERIMNQANQLLNQQSPIPSLEEVFLQAEAEDRESQQIIAEQYQKVLEQRQKIAMDIAKQLVMGEIHNLYKGRYQVATAMSNFSPTAKNANMSLLFDISRIMPGIIPPDYLIKQTDLPDKQVIINEIKARQEAARQAQLNAQRTEIEGKVLIQRAKNEGDMSKEQAKGRNEFINNRANQT